MRVSWLAVAQSEIRGKVPGSGTEIEMRAWISVRFICCGLAVLGVLSGCGGATGADGAGSATASGSSGSTAVSTVKSMQISASQAGQTGQAGQGSVSVGQTFTLTSKVTGGNGKTLTFSVANAASWMTFNSSTGVLTGTPTAADAGTYSNIVISVSDGQQTVSAAPFTVTVVETNAGSGTATVSWTAPTTNTDGSTLTNLAGYNIYYGTSTGGLTQKVIISNPSVTTYVITGLTPGTWYFAVAAYTTNGTQSNLSGIASKTI